MTPKEVTQLYLERHNAHDVDGVLALFEDEADFELASLVSRHGKDAIRLVEEWDAAVHDELRPGHLIAAGDEVTFAAVESNDWLAASGIAELRLLSMTVEVHDDRIARLALALEPASYAALTHRPA